MDNHCQDERKVQVQGEITFRWQEELEEKLLEGPAPAWFWSKLCTIWSTHRREYHRARLFMAESFQHIDSARLADSDFRSDMFASILSIPFHEYFRLAPPGLRFTQMWAEPIPD
jgi:hypothetical protein